MVSHWNGGNEEDQESQDKELGYPSDRFVTHFFVLISQHTQGW